MRKKINETLLSEGGFRSIMLWNVFMMFSLSLFLSACLTPKLPPPSAKYVYEEDKGPRASVNSLWADRAGLYENVRARRLNDLVTINVLESISGSGTADTGTKGKSTLEVGVDSIFGSPLNFGMTNLWGNQTPFVPAASGHANTEFAGSGSTTREGKLVGTITAKVMEVMPNGNLILQSRKEITINNEKQILIIRGVARPDDIAIDNTISSSKIADAEVFFVGDGIVQDKQRPGWFVRIIDNLWPF
jgi:flagellar L-ring protein precursor FlgH